MKLFGVCTAALALFLLLVAMSVGVALWMHYFWYVCAAVALAHLYIACPLAAVGVVAGYANDDPNVAALYVAVYAAICLHQAYVDAKNNGSL